MSLLDAILQTAQEMVGVKYVWGGTNASKGVDCSGFTQLAFAAAGIRLPRVSNDQARAGKAVSQEQARPGDLVWWDLGDRNDGADHIGIYLGNGKVMEASSSRGQVVVRNLWGNANFTRIEGVTGGVPGEPTAIPTPTGGGTPGQQRDTGVDMASVVRSPTGMSNQGKEDRGGPFNLQALYNLVDESDPGERPDTVGPYGVAKMTDLPGLPSPKRLSPEDRGFL